MRKYFLSVAIALSISFVFSACTEEEIIPNQDNTATGGGFDIPDPFIK